MSTDDESSRVSPAYRLIHHYREQAMAAVDRYNQALVDGSVTIEHRRDLATAALNYYNVLFEHREEGALDEPWEKRGITWVKEYAGETVAVEESLNRPNSATKTVRRPKLLAVDPGKLEDVILELNDVLKELDLSVNIAESTGRTDLDDAMERLEKWHRQQE